MSREQKVIERRLHGRSIFDWNRIQTAPQIPRCNRIPWRPTCGVFEYFRFGQSIAIVKMFFDCADQADIVHRKNIGPHQVKNQEHFRRPAADALDFDQFADHVFVGHAVPPARLDAAIREVARQVLHVADFLPRIAGRA